MTNAKPQATEEETSVFVRPRRNIRPARSRWLFRLAVVLVGGLALLAWASRERALNPLTVENRSGQPIPLLKITVGGETSTFKDVPPGAKVTTPFQIKGAEPFGVEGRLADGTLIRGHGKSGEQVGLLVILPGGQTLFRQGEKTSGP